MLELTMINEPLLFDPLRNYCIGEKENPYYRNNKAQVLPATQKSPIGLGTF